MWLKVKRHSIIAVTLSLLFGIGWGVGLAATEGLKNLVAVTVLQAIFIIITAFHGLYLFLMYCLRLKDARNEWKSWMNILLCRTKTKPSEIQDIKRSKGITASSTPGDSFEDQSKKPANGPGALYKRPKKMRNTFQFLSNEATSVAKEREEESAGNIIYEELAEQKENKNPLCQPDKDNTYVIFQNENVYDAIDREVVEEEGSIEMTNRSSDYVQEGHVHEDDSKCKK